MQPNILLIFADELRADALGCYGNTICHTPNLDALAERGTRFNQCMVTQPTCTPSRASVLSGCYPAAMRSRMVGCQTPDDPRFLPHVLGAAGYRTVSIGKIHLRSQGAEVDEVEQTRRADGSCDYFGFHEIDLVNGHGARCFGNLYTPWLLERVPDRGERLEKRKKCSPGVNADGGPETHEWPFPPEVHSSEYIADRAAEFLDQAAHDLKPFFLHVSFPDPHHPFTVPAPYDTLYNADDMPEPLPPVTETIDPTDLQVKTYHGRYSEFVEGKKSDRVIGTPAADYSQFKTADWQKTKAIYYGMTTLMDKCIGRVLDKLRDCGLEKNTIVVFVTDHGDYLGDHGLVGKGFHYDSVIRTPLIMAGPGIRAGRVIEQMASTVDLAPTLLKMAAVEEPAGMQGMSMKAALAGQGSLPRNTALTENDDDFVPMRVRTITTNAWKMTWYLGEDAGELYDRLSDPDELVNLWNEPGCASVKRDLTEQLLAEVVAATDTVNGRTQTPSPPHRKWLPGYF